MSCNLAEARGGFPGELIRVGLESTISNFYQYSWLMCQGAIPAADFVERLEQRKIGVILFKHNLKEENEATSPTRSV